MVRSPSVKQVARHEVATITEKSHHCELLGVIRFHTVENRSIAIRGLKARSDSRLGENLLGDIWWDDPVFAGFHRTGGSALTHAT